MTPLELIDSALNQTDDLHACIPTERTDDGIYVLTVRVQPSERDDGLVCHLRTILVDPDAESVAWQGNGMWLPINPNCPLKVGKALIATHNVAEAGGSRDDPLLLNGMAGGDDDLAQELLDPQPDEPESEHVSVLDDDGHVPFVADETGDWHRVDGVDTSDDRVRVTTACGNTMTPRDTSVDLPDSEVCIECRAAVDADGAEQPRVTVDKSPGAEGYWSELSAAADAARAAQDERAVEHSGRIPDVTCDECGQTVPEPQTVTVDILGMTKTVHKNGCPEDGDDDE